MLATTVHLPTLIQLRPFSLLLTRPLLPPAPSPRGPGAVIVCAVRGCSSAWPGSSPPPRVLTGPNDNLVVLVYPPAVAAAGGGGGGGGGGQAHVLPPASQPPLMVVGNLDAALAQAAESGAGSVNVGGSPAVAAPCNENAPSLQQHKHPAAALGSANHGADEAGAALQRNPLGPRVRRQGVWRAVAVALAVLCAAVVAATVLHGGGGGATAGFDVAAAFWSLFSRLPAASKESVQPAAAVNVATPPSTKPSSVVTALPVAAGVVDDVVHKPRQHLGALLPAALSPGAVAVAAAQCAGGLCPSAQPAAAAAPPSATTQVQQPPPAHGAAATAQPQQAASSPSRKSTVSASDGGAAAALSLPKASPPPPPPPPVPERSVKSMEQQLPTGVARPATPVSDAEAEAARAGIEAVAAAPAFALRRRHVLGFTAGAASVFIAAALYAACRSPSVALAASSILSTSRSLCQRLVAAAARPAGTAPRTAAAPTHSHHSGEASSLTVGGGRSIQLRSRLVVATADTAATATHHRPR